MHYPLSAVAAYICNCITSASTKTVRKRNTACLLDKEVFHIANVVNSLSNHRSENSSNTRGNRHRQCAPKRDSHRRLDPGGSASIGAETTEQCKK